MFRLPFCFGMGEDTSDERSVSALFAEASKRNEQRELFWSHGETQLPES